MKWNLIRSRWSYGNELRERNLYYDFLGIGGRAVAKVHTTPSYNQRGGRQEKLVLKNSSCESRYENSSCESTYENSSCESMHFRISMKTRTARAALKVMFFLTKYRSSRHKASPLLPHHWTLFFSSARVGFALDALFQCATLDALLLQCATLDALLL